MSILYSLKRLYSLDTLDTRFTNSSKIPVQYASSERGIDVTKPAATSEEDVAKQTSQLPGTQPSKWNTTEYYFYYLVFVTAIPLMIYVPYSVSKESNPQYRKFEPLLSTGWIPGRQVDNSDAQYSSFRDNIPYMAIVVIIHPLLRKVYNQFRPLSTSETSRPEVLGEARLRQRVSYDLIFATIFLFVLHGSSAFKVFLIIYTNFTLATSLPKQYIPTLTWLFNISVLFGNELCNGYPYARMAQILSLGGQPPLNWGARLDSYGGLVPRWEVLFNLTVLRLISFNLDYYWSLDQRGSSPVEKKQLDPANLSERDRVAIPASAASFSLKNYLSYILYSPLYLTGPIVTFNDYVHQLRHPSQSITTSRTILYGVRFVLCLLCMEVMLHYIYAVAISKAGPDWSLYTPFQLSMLGYFNLHIIWLKLLLPWRFFRLWALLDNVDPPENMVRCMSDNYSALAFWRGWHRSFNRWIVRYIFIPLGGSGRGTSPIRSICNMIAVFTFVALWHDISLQLLTWSWLIILFLLPEIICSKVLFPARAYKDRPNTYRMLAGLGAVANILMMMAANLVGFALGLDGLKDLAKGIVSGWEGYVFLLSACATLFVGAMVMFEHRESERRRGISMSC